MDIRNQAILWTTSESSPHIPSDWYCKTRDVFQARLEKFLSLMEKEIGTRAYLLTAIVGEIGNNSFDHNLGNWRDTPGVLFAYDPAQKLVVLADRGQGVLKTISRVLPTVIDHKEALTVAFTQTVSGRSPERRGNGLKFVLRVLRDNRWKMEFYSGNGVFFIDSESFRAELSTMTVNGCLGIITY